MAIAELVMPKLGESIMEATILKWHKKVGDSVQLEETVLDIATDKVDSEVPSTAAGVITEILYNVNDVVPIGAVIARIETGGAAATPAAPVAAAAPQPTPAPAPQPQPQPVYSAPTPPPAPVEPEPVPYVPTNTPVVPGNNRFYSPLVLNIANSEGISLSELERIPGTGAEGRVTKKDVLQYVADKRAGKVPAFVAPQPAPAAAPAQAPVYTPAPEPMPVAQPVATPVPAPVAMPEPEPVYTAPAAPVYTTAPQAAPEPVAAPIQPTPRFAPAPQPVAPAPQPAPVQQVISPAPAQTAPQVITTTAAGTPPPVFSSGATEIIEMDRMRKLIANHMVMSKQTSPHVTSFVEADVTNMVNWRNRIKEKFETLEGGKLTFTPMFIEAIVKVMKRYPMINASVEGDKIILKKDINIGMATALPTGNLIVPVIKSADQLNLLGLSRWVNHLADSARNNKLKPDDTQGGTFTLTNVGTFGSLMGTPIINQPQVAILAVGAIKKRPVVIETDKGDFIGIRHMMYLSMSYDHRIVDGSIGAQFLTDVAKEFEAWDVNREIVVESINRIAVI